jgi:hypothetical protein
VKTLYITDKNAPHYLRFIEWTAYRYLVFNKDRMLIAETFDSSIGTAWSNWPQSYNLYRDKHSKDPAALALHELFLQIMDGSITNLDEFYHLLRTKVTHRKRGNALKDQRIRQAKQSAIQQARRDDGKAFVSNNKLISMTKKAAVRLAHTDISEVQISDTLQSLVAEYNPTALTDDEMDVLRSIFTRKVIAMEASLTAPEATILRQTDKDVSKNAFHLYGLFKLKCEVNDTWALGQQELCKELGVGRPKALAAANLLVKLGLITVSEQGKRGTVMGKTTIYKRLK